MKLNIIWTNQYYLSKGWAEGHVRNNICFIEKDDNKPDSNLYNGIKIAETFTI